MKRVWLTYEAGYYREHGGASYAHKTKSDAVADARSEGFKYNKRDDLFENDDAGLYRRIESIRISNFLAPVVSKQTEGL